MAALACTIISGSRIMFEDQIYATCAQILFESDVKNGTLPKGIEILEGHDQHLA
jgi:hypothetical protein